MKIIIIVLLFYSGLVFSQQFKLTDEPGSYYTIDRFANEVYFIPWYGSIIKKVNLVTKEVIDTQLPALPVFMHNTHKAIYHEVTDTSNIYYLNNFETDSIKILFEVKFSNKLLKTEEGKEPFYTISPDDKKLFVGSAFLIEDSIWIASSEAFINYLGFEFDFIWGSDSTIIFKSVENSIAEYNIYSQNIDTLVNLDIDNPITGFDYNINNKLLAYSTGEGFSDTKLFIYNQENGTVKKVFDPNIQYYFCQGMWFQFDELKWCPNGEYLAFLGYNYTNPATGIHVYDLLADSTINITRCDHYGLKQNLNWVNADSILYRREDLDEIYGYNLHDKLTLVENNKPDVYQLTLSNYPNPFNPSTIIKYTIPANSNNVNLTIYDILGRIVEDFVIVENTAGEYEVFWNPAENNKNISSGIYFVRLEIYNSSKRINKLHKILYLK